jgi:ABC-type branched-subunit amino acid transport system substrate-binding protein
MKKILIFLLLVFVLTVYYLNNSQKEHLIGSSLPLEGIMKELGISVKLGTEVSFKFYGEGLSRKIKYIFSDDKYEPELTKENIKNFYKKNVFLLYGIVGTPTVKKILPFLNDNSIFLYAPFTGAEFLRKNKYVINFRASYKDEIKKIINYLINRKITEIAVFYQNDEYGNEIYYHTYEVLKSKNLKLSAVGTYKRNTFFITSALNEISHNRPQAIIMASTSKVSAMFIQKYRKIDPNTIFCTVSFVNPDNLVKELTNTKNIIFSEVVPYYNDDSIKEAILFKKQLKKLYPNIKPTFFAFEAYLANKILLRAFEKLKFPYTSSHLVNIIKNTPNNYLKGIQINYKNNQLLNKTYLFVFENNRFKEIR